MLVSLKKFAEQVHQIEGVYILIHSKVRDLQVPEYLGKRLHGTCSIDTFLTRLYEYLDPEKVAVTIVVPGNKLFTRAAWHYKRISAVRISTKSTEEKFPYMM